MFETIYSQVGAALTIVVVAFAFLKGDEPERLGCAAVVLVFLAGIALPLSMGVEVPRWGAIALDVLLLAVFIGLARHSRRAWPVWASAFQSLIVTGHVLVLANLRPPTDAFAALNNLATYAVLVTLAIGTFWAWQERRASGRE